MWARITNVQLVTDGDKWAVRRGWIFYQYWTGCYWWGINSSYSNDSWFTKEVAEQLYYRVLGGFYG